MKTWRRSFFTAIVLLVVLGGGYLFIESGRDRRFARAEADVRDAREKLAGEPSLIGVFKQVGKAVEPSVVQINVKKTAKAPRRMLPDDDMLRRFFPDRDGDGEPDLPEGFRDRLEPPDTLQGTGSGVIIEFDKDAKKAYIITNNHVAGGAEEMLITLADGREVTSGKVIGADPKSDLAVVRADLDRVIPAKWGDSETLEKGDWILAFGSPFGYVGSMTHGIVSALHRRAGLLGSMGYENFIQVDAPINPGNSGGPLVNLQGEVVGINCAIASRSGGFQGIGFAIPSNQAKFVYEQLKAKGKVIRGWLGVSISDVSRDKAKAQSLGFKGEWGVLVEQTFPKTPAHEKLLPGDVIVELDGKPAKTLEDLRDKIARMAPGTDLKLKVVREGKNVEVTVKLGEQPDDVMALRTPLKTPATKDASTEAIGLRVSDITPELGEKFDLGDVRNGAVITSVDRRSVAAEAGLRPGDVITHVAGKPVKTADAFVEAMKAQDLKKGIRLTVAGRDGSRLVFLRQE